MYPLIAGCLYSAYTNGVEDSRGVVAHFVNYLASLLGFIYDCMHQFYELSTARSEKRAKEVGIRKVVGAQKSSLISQFIGESVFLAFLAGIIAILIVQISLPIYNQLTLKNFL